MTEKDDGTGTSMETGNQPIKTLAGALSRKSFSITAEIPLRAGSPIEEILQRAKELLPWVDGIQVSENPRQSGQVSPVALAALLLNEGIDPITRLNCRDRNRLALHGDLVGLKLLGVSSLILDRGNRLEIPGLLPGKPVFDINGRHLIMMASEISEERLRSSAQEFMAGTSVNAFFPNPGWNAPHLEKLASAGARFVQTQPCFSVPLLRRYVQRLVELKLTWKFAVIVTLAPLPGMEFARWQLDNPRGTRVPKAIANELAAASDPEQAGIAICARQMRKIAAIPGVSGINLLTLGNPAAVAAAIEASGLRRPD
jgi:methylenetetrahydrofolate reductase (NADPH)